MYRAAILPEQFTGGGRSSDAPQHTQQQDGEKRSGHTSIYEFPRAEDGAAIVLQPGVVDRCGRDAITPVTSDRMILMSRRLTQGVI